MHTEKPSLISHNKPRLLLVEDDPSLGDGIHCALTISGYETVWSVDGLEADRRLKQDHFDLVVLDLGLPGIPGLEVLRGMRTRGDHTPVLILTAQDSIEDRMAFSATMDKSRNAELFPNLKPQHTHEYYTDISPTA